jgi:hypothetical protein
MCSSIHQSGVVGWRWLEEAGGFASRWKEVEVIALPDDDELKAPKLDVEAQSKVDVISGHWRLDGVERDAQSSPTWRANCQCSRTGGV